VHKAQKGSDTRYVAAPQRQLPRKTDSIQRAYRPAPRIANVVRGDLTLWKIVTGVPKRPIVVILDHIKSDDAGRRRILGCPSAVSFPASLASVLLTS
jgi:hypothetical protein